MDAAPRSAAAAADGALPLVIGLGNEHRGDDAAGLWVARRLAPRLAGRARVVELGGDGARLIELWDGADLAIVVDAVTSDRPPGTVHRIEVGAEPLPSSLGATSTHAVSLAQAVALGQALGRRPRRLLIFGIEGRRFAPGASPSPEVTAAIDPLAAAVERELASAGPEASDAAAGRPGRA